jgi:trimeric autotransporter adhesin
MRSAGVIFGFLLLSATVAAQQYVISTYAGGAPPPTPVRGVDVPFGAAFGVAADAAGNVYFPSLNCVFKLDQNGVLTRVAGNSRAGYSGDGGPATSAQLGARWGVAVDGVGNLFIADDKSVRKVSASGIITTVAGNGTPGFSGDGGPAPSAQLNGAISVAVDNQGTLFIADYNNRRIRKVPTSGIITTVAGNGILGYSGDGGAATSAALGEVTGIAVDGAGNVFIASFGVVRKVSPGGIITTVAGGGTAGLGDGGQATGAEVQPWGVAVDSAGNLFIAEYLGRRIRKVSPNGTITTVAGGGTADLGDGGPATKAQLGRPGAVAVDGEGNLFIADERIRKVSSSGIITTVAGNGRDACCFSGDGGPATAAQVQPSGVALDGARNLFVAGDNRIRKVSPEGIITTVVGNGTSGFSGDGGPAISAQLNSPRAMAVDSAGNLFIADGGNQRIRKVSPSGIITTVAGNGTQGYFGDGGPATSAQLVAGSLAVDSASNLYIAAGNVRKISPAGIISSVAGSGAACDEDSCPPLGDGGPATSASMYATSVAVDGVGNLIIADVGNSRIRKVTPDGIISTLAKDVVPCYVALDGSGNLFIAECFPGGISRISTSGIITRVVAAGGGYSGDGGPAISAQMYYATAVAVDGAGDIYVADSVNNAVLVLRPTDRTVLIGAVVDAASQRADPVSPGKIVVVYGTGLGPSQLIQNRSSNAQFGTELAGTVVSFNGIAAPILYTSATQVAAIVPYAISGTTAQVAIAYQGATSTAFTIPVTPSAPGIFTSNQTGAGQVAAINTVDGTLNTAANPVKIGGYISLYATGEGQTAPAGMDGKLGSTPTRPVLPVSVTVDGMPATVLYAGGAPGQVAGLMQLNVQIPDGVQPGGYVPVVLQVGDASTTPGAVWVAVSGN